jgi:hypothetical protein
MITTNRELIVALRGEFVSKTLHQMGDIALLGHGYEHYDEPMWFQVVKVSTGQALGDSYSDVEAIENAAQHNSTPMTAMEYNQFAHTWYEKRMENDTW